MSTPLTSVQRPAVPRPSGRRPTLTRKKRVIAAVVALTAGFATFLPATAGAAAQGVLTISNLDVLPGSSSAVMSKIQNPADTYQRMHSTVTLRLTNTGDASLYVNSLSTTGPFTLTSPWQLPFKLTAGSSVNFTATFTATSGAWHTGAATVNWTAGAAQTSPTQTSTIALTGWWQKYSEHGLEPWLPDLIGKLGYKTVMPTAIYSRGAYKAFSSDEVLNPYWSARDASQPIRITELGSWRGYPSGVIVSKFPRGNPASTTQVFSGLRQDAQSILPRNSAWARGTATFSIDGPIGLKVDNEFTDPTLNDQSVDRAAGCTATVCGQHLRIWRVRDSNGAIVPGAYLMAEDFGGINYDYNDNVFLLENLDPVS